MPSFDVVSKLDWAEVNNALNQAQRELAQRYDFKGTQAKIEQAEKDILLEANSDERAKAAYQVFQEKLIRRKVSLKHFEAGDPTPGAKGSARIKVTVTEGINQDKAREIVKRIKGSKIKVQAAIHEDSVRVSGKKRDDLQQVIADLREADLGLELQFINFRD